MKIIGQSHFIKILTSIFLGFVWGLVMLIAVMNMETKLESMSSKIVYAIHYPAWGAYTAWRSMGMTPHSEAAFALPLIFVILQWMFIGLLLGITYLVKGGRNQPLTNHNHGECPHAKQDKHDTFFEQ